jgi:ribosomal protein S18 acetylase RimI-like enzyme
VNALSNLLGKREGLVESSASEPISRPATGADVVPALRLVLGSNGRLADESQVTDFLRFTNRRGVSLSDLQVMLMREQLIWALLPMVSPGRTMLMFTAPVEFASGHIAAVETTIENVCKHFASRDVQLAQMLLDPADDVTIMTYKRCGFRHMAELYYLNRTVRRAQPPPPLPANFQTHHYSAQMHGAFAKAILASYEKSLDCPPLNGLRGVEDIITGHKAAGEFDPEDWFVVTLRNEPVAVLLLSRTISVDGMELVYLGVAPGVRGHGLGEHLMRLAESRVSQRKLTRLTLAVDSLNEPALKLYYRHGMQRVTSKIALMRELRDRNG